MCTGDSSRLRQVFVHRAGHCTFSPAETITAFKTLVHWLDTGRWEDGTDPASMNSQATGLGAALNVILDNNGNVVPAAASFTHFQPAQFLRPFDARNLGEESGD